MMTQLKDGQHEKDRAAVRAKIEVLRRERLAYEQESMETRQALARSRSLLRALEAHEYSVRELSGVTTRQVMMQMICCSGILSNHASVKLFMWFNSTTELSRRLHSTRRVARSGRMGGETPSPVGVTRRASKAKTLQQRLTSLSGEGYASRMKRLSWDWDGGYIE
ncbi:hypothetical protein Tco_1563193 [Tanacetum coccineum]